jgi:hypothetical protein
MTPDPATTVGDLVSRLLAALHEGQTRYPGADATWETAVIFARRWVDLGGVDRELTLTPRGRECTVEIAIEPWNLPAARRELAALLGRIAVPSTDWRSADSG